MSLGWQCESALLPSKAKPINVDGKSMMGLKALVYNEERQRQLNTGTNIARRIKQVEKTQESRRQTSTKRSDQAKETEEDRKEDMALRALDAKAKLYEQIVSGKERLKSDLIDFDEKRSSSEFVTEPTRIIVPPPKPPSIPKPDCVSLTSRDATVSSSTSYNALPSGVSTVPHYNWSRTYNTNSDGNTNATDGHGGEGDYNNMYLQEVRQERELRTAVEGRLRDEGLLRDQQHSSSRSSDVPSAQHSAVSEAARVKTQWEKALNSSARAYLDEVHSDAARQRELSGTAESSSAMVDGTGAPKRSLKEERLEMIRQKRSRVANTGAGADGTS